MWQESGIGIGKCVRGNRLPERNFKLLSLVIAGIFCTILPALPCKAQGFDTHSVLNEVIEKIGEINTVSYHLSYRERIYESGKMRSGSSDIRYQKYPRKVYIKTENGTELLWGPGMNEGDVLVHPSSFPFFNLNLDPNGYWMRKDQHHGIGDVGFDYISMLLKATIAKAGNDFDSHFLYKGAITFDSAACIEIDIIAQGFKYIPYTVKKGENILTIARSNALNEYMTLKHNPAVSSYTDVKEGQSIILPSDYAPLVTLYIKKQTLLPVLLRVEDEKGLFEEYVYRNIKINPAFEPDEFSKDCKEYHF